MCGDLRDGSSQNWAQGSRPGTEEEMGITVMLVTNTQGFQTENDYVIIASPKSISHPEGRNTPQRRGSKQRRDAVNESICTTAIDLRETNRRKERLL